MAAKQGGKKFLMETQLALPIQDDIKSLDGVCVFQNLTVSC